MPIPDAGLLCQPDKIIAQAEHALDFTTWTKEEQDMWDKQLDSIEVSYATLITSFILAFITLLTRLA